MPVISKKFLATLLLTLFTTLPLEVMAQSLFITDCNGFLRASQSVEANSLNKVEIQVADAAGGQANGTQVTLTNSISGEVTTVQAQNGIATFQAVPSGSFSVSVAQTGMQVGAITVSGSGLGAVAAAGVVAGSAGAGAGAAAGAVVAVDEVVNDNKSDSTPTPEPTEPPTETPTPIAPTPVPTPQPTIDDCRCEPDAEPTPTDDFEPPFPDDTPLSPAQ